MNPPHELTIDPSVAGERLDRAIAATLRNAGRVASVREVRNALRDGTILVEGRRRSPGDRSTAGMTIRFDGFTPRAEATTAAEERDIEVLFEDDTMIVVAKPSGIPTTPIRPNETGTLLNAVVALAPAVADAGPPIEGGAVHRLDTETSGVVAFAKTKAARATLREAFRAHRVEKRYVAFAAGARTAGETFTVDVALAQAGDHVNVDDAGLAAESDVTVEASNDGLVRLSVVTRFGRRHQVRAHLAHAGLPICGDERYGDGSDWDGRLALHAALLRLDDGRTFEAPMPEDLRALQERFS